MKLLLQSILILFAWFGSTAFAAPKKVHREHAAHKHGAAKMDFAFEGSNGQFNIEIASEAIYGFEYTPTTEADKKKQHDGLSNIETDMVDMVKFDPSLKCEISKIKLEVDQHDGGKHSDIDGEFKVTCDKSPIGSTIVFNIQKSFPNLKTVDVQFVADDLQKSFKANKDGAKLVLKK
jgi:hypothetical protein